VKLPATFKEHRTALLLAAAGAMVAAAAALAVVSLQGGTAGLPPVVTAADGVVPTSPFCLRAQAVLEALQQNDRSIAAEQQSDPRQSPTALVEADLRTIRQNVAYLAETSPSDLAGYFTEILSVLHQAIRTVSYSSGDPMKVASDATEGMRYAIKVVTAYMGHHCQLDFRIGTAPSSTSTSTSLPPERLH